MYTIIIFTAKTAISIKYYLSAIIVEIKKIYLLLPGKSTHFFCH